MRASPLVALTGGTGFLGRRLVAALERSGLRVRALARRPNAAWDGARPETVIGHLGDEAALADLTRNADVVIHCAGAIKALRRSDFFAANVDGSAAIARASNADRVIMVSSLAARGPEVSDYAASKRAGEDAARAVLGERLMILRPPAIYGPGDRETLSLFRAAAASPVLPMPADPEARLALAHVDDVVDAIVNHATGAWSAGAYAFGGERPAGYGWREIFETAAASVGRNPRLVPVPDWVLRGAASMSGVASQILRQPAIFTPGKANEILRGGWSVDETEEAPGPRSPRLPLTEGFRRTVAWYRAAGWLR